MDHRSSPSEGGGEAGAAAGSAIAAAAAGVGSTGGLSRAAGRCCCGLVLWLRGHGGAAVGLPWGSAVARRRGKRGREAARLPSHGGCACAAVETQGAATVPWAATRGSCAPPKAKNRPVVVLTAWTRAQLRKRAAGVVAARAGVEAVVKRKTAKDERMRG